MEAIKYEMTAARAASGIMFTVTASLHGVIIAQGTAGTQASHASCVRRAQAHALALCTQAVALQEALINELVYVTETI